MLRFYLTLICQNCMALNSTFGATCFLRFSVMGIFCLICITLNFNVRSYFARIPLCVSLFWGLQTEFHYSEFLCCYFALATFSQDSVGRLIEIFAKICITPIFLRWAPFFMTLICQNITTLSATLQLRFFWLKIIGYHFVMGVFNLNKIALIFYVWCHISIGICCLGLNVITPNFCIGHYFPMARIPLSATLLWTFSNRIWIILIFRSLVLGATGDSLSLSLWIFILRSTKLWKFSRLFSEFYFRICGSNEDALNQIGILTAVRAARFFSSTH